MKPYISLLFFILFSCSPAPDSKGIRPVKLTCEYLENPSVVDVRAPRLTWINMANDSERGQKQTAWQVRVATSKSGLTAPDLWDSDKVLSDQSSRVEYSGKILTSRLECWWQVRVWDKNDVASKWSEPAFWRMGLLEPSDWEADWIGVPWQGEEALPKPPGGPDALPTEYPPPAPLLRKTFQINKEVKSVFHFRISGRLFGSTPFSSNTV